MNFFAQILKLCYKKFLKIFGACGINSESILHRLLLFLFFEHKISGILLKTLFLAAKYYIFRSGSIDIRKRIKSKNIFFIIKKFRLSTK